LFPEQDVLAVGLWLSAIGSGGKLVFDRLFS